MVLVSSLLHLAVFAQRSHHLVQPAVPQFDRHTARTQRHHVGWSLTRAGRAHPARMRQLHQTRGSPCLRQSRPLLPLAQMRFLQRILMTDHVALDRQEPDVDLHLAGDEATVIRMRPLRVEVLPLVERRVVQGPHSESLLHRTFYKPVWECETAGEGDGLRNELRRGHWGRRAHFIRYDGR